MNPDLIPRTFMLAVILFLLFLAFAWFLSPAQAHDWYSGTRDPVINWSCCGEGDCKAVPLDADWVTPTRDGFRVKMTAEQAKSVHAGTNKAFDEVIPWARVQSPPKSAHDHGHPLALYHVCIWYGQLRCLFAIPGS